MAEDSDQPDEIQSILTDLDAILKDMGGGKPAARPGSSGPVLPLPGLSAKPVEAPKPIPKTPDPAPPTPPPAAPKILDKPPLTEPQTTALPSVPATVSVPPVPAESSAVAASGLESLVGEPTKAQAPMEPPKSEGVISAPIAADLPADTPKDQIRRVAYIHTQSSQAAQTGFSEFLSNAARTISKKPLYLREVASLEVHLGSDVNVVVDKARAVKAAAIFAIVEGWPSTKADELAEACQRNNILFRLVPVADAQKKSTAVDIIVDMMLLPGEG